MKKTLLFIAGLFSLLSVSCTQEKIEQPANGAEATVTFTAALPEVIATKAYSDGTTAKKLEYGVYVSGTNTPVFQKSDVKFNESLEATVELTLATGVSYDLIFWAESEGTNPYSVDWNAKTMTVDHKNIKANDENNDAFYAYVSALKVEGSVNKTVELFRPFAQINLGTNDYTQASAAGLDVDRTNMLVTLPTVLNFVNGTVGTEEEYTFAVNTIGKDETFPVGGYKYLEMNYVLADAQKSTANFTFNVWEEGMQTSLTPNIYVSNVPMQRNYQTNIYGSLLTDPANITVVIKPAYTEPDFNVPADVAAIYEAAKNGGEISLESNVVLDEPLVIENDLVINLNGHDIKYKSESENNVDFQLFRVFGNELTIEGTGSISSCYYTFRVDQGGVLNLAGDIEYFGNISVVQLAEGTVNIKAGTFDMVPENTYGTQYMLNCIDSYYTAGTAKFNVMGGSFVGFNPADNTAEGANTNFVAEGYESVKREDADIYDVKVKAGDAVVTITTAEELRTMLNTLTDSGSGNNKIIINANIELAEGEVWEPVVIEGYTGAGVITIEGNGHHISGLSAPLFKSGFAGKSGVKITDLTIKDSQMGHDATGYAGVFFGACDSMESLEFYNCHVENVTLSGSNYVAGFVGWISGWNLEGPVVTDCIIEDCSVKNCKFTAGGSVGGFIGHAGANPNTIVDIIDSNVTGCVFDQVETEDGAQGRADKVGYAIGTVNIGQKTAVTGVTGDGNTYKLLGVDKGKLEKMVGRLSLGSTGHFYVDGEEVTSL